MLEKPLQVTVLSANHGYLIKARFFGEDVATAETNILDHTTMMSTSAHLVDDIWMNGVLARRGIKRYVVPLQDGTSSHELAKFPRESRLEKTLHNSAITRADANDEILLMFKKEWLREGLWYDAEDRWWKSSLKKKSPKKKVM